MFFTPFLLHAVKPNFHVGKLYISAAASKKRERERGTGVVKKYELNSDYRINLISTCFDQKWIVYYFGEKKEAKKIENQ